MTVILEETYTRANALDIPKIGLGTWFIDDAEAAQVVRDAAALGYRHIDTAQAYGNEAGVGEGVRSCGVPRQQMFVTTKLAAEVKSFEEAASAVNESLVTTGLDYLDLMIIHSPQPWRGSVVMIGTSTVTATRGEPWKTPTKRGSSAPSGSRTSKRWTSTTSSRHARSSRW